MGTAPDIIRQLADRFAQQADQLRSPDYNETLIRIDFINPLMTGVDRVDARHSRDAQSEGCCGSSPFLCGAVRLLASAGVFLELNGVDFDARPEEFEQICLSVAEGSLTKAEVAAFFRRFTQAVPD
jgi:hypothetical protein